MRTPSITETRWPLASKKRLLLALYLDYLIFCAPWGIAFWVLTTSILDVEREPFGLRFILFALLETLFLKFIKWSPGQRLLGVRDSVTIDPAIPIEKGGKSIVKVVEPWLKSNERWWTILFGVLAILNGSKSMVRWTLWDPPTPFFGIQLEATSSVFLMIILGAFECTVGMAALRLRPFVLPMGALYYSSNLISVLVSWHLWPDFIEKSQIARRQYQGIPIRPGEIETMQALAPTALVFFPIAILVYLAIVYLRVRKAFMC